MGNVSSIQICKQDSRDDNCMTAIVQSKNAAISLILFKSFR